jgi:hypothetical protein
VLRANEEIITNEDQSILNKDCQYYIEYEPQDYNESSANDTDQTYGFILPKGWVVQE